MGNNESKDRPNIPDDTDASNVMTALWYRKHGELENLELLNLISRPIPRKGQALIKVHTCGINPSDIKLVENDMKLGVPLPKIIGCDFSGIVVSVDQCNTHYLRVGERVCGMLPLLGNAWGSAAQYIAVDESLCAVVPEGVDLAGVAGIPTVSMAVIQALSPYVKRQLQRNPSTGCRGQKVLIHGGSGGLGTFAIQYCGTVLGMTVATTVSGRNVDLVRDLGASQIVNYETERFEDVVSDCDVVLDTKSYIYEQRSLKCPTLLKPNGVYVNILSSSNTLDPAHRDKLGLSVPERSLGRLLNVGTRYGWNNLLHFVRVDSLLPSSATGPCDGRHAYSFLAQVRPDGYALRLVMSMLSSDAVRPVVDLIYPLHRAHEALAFVKTGKARGKVLLQVEGYESMHTTLKIVSKSNQTVLLK